MFGSVLDVLDVVLVVAILFHPTENIFSASRYLVYPLLLVFVVGRLLLSRKRFCGAVALGNISLLLGFIAFLFTFTTTDFWPVRYFVGFGWLLNWLVIAINGGRMPVEPSVLLRRKRQLTSDNSLYFVEQENTRLKILDDRIYTPFLSTKVISIGDIFIRLGVIVTFSQSYFL